MKESNIIVSQFNLFKPKWEFMGDRQKKASKGQHKTIKASLKRDIKIDAYEGQWIAYG